MLDIAAKAYFDVQHGLITRTQAIEAGMTKAQIRYRVISGEWVRVHYGVYRHAMVTRSWKGDAMLGVLATGGVCSHETAARLHRFGKLGRMT